MISIISLMFYQSIYGSLDFFEKIAFYYASAILFALLSFVLNTASSVAKVAFSTHKIICRLFAVKQIWRNVRMEQKLKVIYIYNLAIII